MPAARPALPAHTSTVFCGAVPFVRGAAAAELPQRVKLLAWGENLARTAKSRIVVGAKTAACLSANQVATACERVPLDYEHQSVKGHPNFIPDPRDVAGHVSIEIVPQEGVYMSAIDFTSSGQRFAGNYQDVSAVAYLDAESNLLFIRSVALTQHGQVSGMEFAEAIAASALFDHPATTMDTPATPDYRAMLVTLLNLSPLAGQTEVSDEEIAAAIATEAAEATEPGEGAGTVAASATAEAATAAVTAAAAAATAATATVPDATTEVALSARMDTLERRGAIDRAISQGKAIPLSDEVLATLPFVALSALLDGLPAGAVAQAPGTSAREIPAARVLALSADQARVAKSLGLSEAEYRLAIG